MNLSTFKPEEYPIVVQVIKDYLSIYQPDFDYRVMEPYRPSDVGQTEMLIMKMRRELVNKAKLKANPSEIPTPTKSKSVFDIVDPASLSTKDAAQILGVSDMTIVRMADEGSLPCKKTPKGHRRFKRSDVIKFVEKNDSSTPNVTQSSSTYVQSTIQSTSPHPSSNLQSFELTLGAETKRQNPKLENLDSTLVLSFNESFAEI